MVDITKYLDKNLIEKLKSNGLDDKEIEMHVEKVETQCKSLFPDNYENAIKNKCKGYFAYFLQSGEKQYKAILIGLNKINDNNFTSRINGKSKSGQEVPLYKTKTNEKYIIKEGYFSYGFNQGKPIPNTSSWEQSGMIGVQIGNELVFKSIRLQGDWVSNDKVNTAKPGDILRINVKELDIQKDTIYQSKPYSLGEPLSPEKFQTIIDTKLNNLVKSFKEISESKFKGMVVLKDVSVVNIELPSTEGNASVVTFADRANTEFDPRFFINVYMNEIEFHEMADGLTLIADSYYSNAKEVIGLNLYKVLIPENMKAIVAPKIEASVETETVTLENTSNEESVSKVLPEVITEESVTEYEGDLL